MTKAHRRRAPITGDVHAAQGFDFGVPPVRVCGPKAEDWGSGTRVVLERGALEGGGEGHVRVLP
jgi:hypothetical protein